MSSNPDPYYALPQCSNTDLSEINKLLNPGIYTFDYEQSLRFGSLVDAMITEPERINVYKRSLDGEIYLQSDFDRAREMKRAFYSDKTCAALMRVASCQHISIGDVEFEYSNFKYSLPCRSKWDIYVKFLNQGADIKTTTATSQKQFEEACHHFNYFRSRVFYMKLENTKKDMLIGISKVNNKIFKIPITYNDKYYRIGEQQANELSFQYWLNFHEFLT